MVVIGIILILMSLALTVTSAVLAANDRRSLQMTFAMLEQAVESWQSQAGHELTTGRRSVPPGTPGPADFTLAATGPSAGYDIYEENFNSTYAICVVLERLATNPDSAEIIARIPSSSIRFVPRLGATPLANAVEPLPAAWNSSSPQTNSNVQTNPNQMPPYASVREIFDPWNRRVAVMFPGRAATKKELADALAVTTPPAIPLFDFEDGSVRTWDEYTMGVCRSRRLCFVSAGPDGDFTTYGDNIFSYEPLPRPAQ